MVRFRYIDLADNAMNDSTIGTHENASIEIGQHWSRLRELDHNLSESVRTSTNYLVPGEGHLVENVAGGLVPAALA